MCTTNLSKLVEFIELNRNLVKFTIYKNVQSKRKFAA